MADKDKKPRKKKPPVIPQEIIDGRTRPVRAATEEELQTSLENLVPNHCSFPDGGTFSRQSGLHCRARKVPGGVRCRFHGGRFAKGVQNHLYKTGRYSKYVPEGLLSRYKDAMEDEDYLDGRAEIATATTRIGMLWERLQNSGSSEAWRELKECYESVQNASKVNDVEGLRANLDRIGEIVTAAGETEAVWADMYEALEMRSKLVDRDWKRQRDMKKVMTLQQAMDMVSMIVGAVTRHVGEKKTLQLINNDINHILLAPGVVVEPDAHALPGAVTKVVSARKDKKNK